MPFQVCGAGIAEQLRVGRLDDCCQEIQMVTEGIDILTKLIVLPSCRRQSQGLKKVSQMKQAVCIVYARET